jgi:hypothetical protein
METFLALNEVLVGLSVVIAAVSNYLIVNKLWSRRMKKDVAQSLSISAALLGLATALPFFIQFVLVDQNWAAAGKSAIGIVTGIVFVLVGTGIWVTEFRGEGFFRLFARALNLERKESADLVRALVQPAGAQELLRVFEAMASVDKHVDSREIEMITDFARRWHIHPPDLQEGDTEHDGDVVALRQSVDDYLQVSPPADQAMELLDVLHIFVQADGKISNEEELVLEEITGMIAGYVSSSKEAGLFEVVIVPQNEEQRAAATSLFPGIEPKSMRGGVVYSVGHFFSARYADVVCDKYISLGLFTTRVDG